MPTAIVLDASAATAFAAKEPGRYQRIAAFNKPGAVIEWFAPGLIVGEVLYALRRKLAERLISPVDHAAAVASFRTLMQHVTPPIWGDASLIPHADRLQSGWPPRDTNDSVYLALAEQLVSEGYDDVSLLTCDGDQSIRAGLIVGVTPVLIT